MTTSTVGNGSPEALEIAEPPRRRVPPPASPSLFDHVPGDLGPPVIGHTLQFVHDARRLVHRLMAEHGELFKVRVFGHPVVVVGEADAVRAVFLDRNQTFSNWLGWHHSIGELFAGGLMLRDGEEHRRHRRIMQSAFRPEAIQGYCARMNPIIEQQLDRLDTQVKASPGRTWRFYPAIKQMALDLASEVFLGIPLGDAADRLNRAFMDAVAASIAVIKKEVPFLAYQRGMKGRRRLQSFFRPLIAERRNSSGTDLFTQLCQATTAEGERFVDEEIVDHMIFLMMAAHDTTTSSLATVAWLLAEHPEWQQHLRAESAAIGGSLDYDDRDRLEKTEWVFKEAIRLHPPVPFISRRTVAACELSGLRLPAQAPVAVCSLVTHFSDKYWTDPFRFDPQRFGADRAEDRCHSHAYYPFGGGSHMCLGMHFANLQVKMILHQFLQRFRMQLEPGHQVKMMPIPIPHPKDGLPLLLELVA